MPQLPEPDWLSLREARDRALAIYTDSKSAAIERALVQAFYDGRVRTEGRCRSWFGHDTRGPLGRYVWDPDRVGVDWDRNRFGRIGDDNRLHTFLDVYVRRRDLENRFARATARKTTPSETSAHETTEPIERPAPPVASALSQDKATLDQPQIAPPAGIRTIQAARAEEKCRRLLAGKSTRPANKEAAFVEMHEAVAHVGPLSRKAFDRAWASAAPTDWKRSGRRRKSQSPEI